MYKQRTPLAFSASLLIAVILFALPSTSIAKAITSDTETGAGTSLSKTEKEKNEDTKEKNEDTKEDKSPHKGKGERVSLQVLGTLQLVSHDLYNVNRITGVDSEDDKLNLSTLLDYGQENIANGGEPRNGENIAVHTVAVELGHEYLHFLKEGKTPQEARHLTVQIYIHKVKEAYEKTFPGSFPKPDPNADQIFANDLDGDLALRTLHAFLPGTIKVNGVMTPILDPSLVGKTLSKKDMMQLSRPMDGTFDPAFRHITIIIPPNNIFTIDLLERDSSFAQQFHTDFTFEHFLGELTDGKYNTNDDVMKVIKADFASAQVGIP